MTYVATNDIICVATKREVNMLSAKMGRPTDSPKNTMIRVRLDAESVANLKTCAETLNISMSDVVRKGINLVMAEIKK